MVFDDNDLIQANATIISGVLILLSLASISRTSSLPLLDRTMIASAIIPFIASTILLLNLRLNEVKRTDYARKLAIWGLIYLAAAVLCFCWDLYENGSTVSLLAVL
jgi:hypothetical protein